MGNVTTQDLNQTEKFRFLSTLNVSNVMLAGMGSLRTVLSSSRPWRQL